jgi:hypothetical protein
VDRVLRSITLLGMGFAGVVAATLGLAVLIVPDPAGSSPNSETGSPGASGAAVLPAPSGGIPGLGGTLMVTGDREGTFVLSRESLEGSYTLVGSLGRITFDGLEISQLSYDGLDFFLDPRDCTITSGNLDNAVGIGFAELSCIDIADVRETGTITIEGTIGLPVDRLVERELPPTGGSIAVGDETWTFEFAYLYLWQQPAIAGVTDANMELADEAQETSLSFFYDIQTHRTTVSGAMRDGETVDVPGGACALQREELGRPNPRTTTVQLGIDCPSVEIPGLGPVPITGTVIVDELDYPF